MARKDVLREEVRRTHGRGLDGLVDAMQHQEQKKSHLEVSLSKNSVPTIAVSDYVKMVSEQIGPYVPGPYYALGTDGFGRSETRDALRRFFEVDRYYIVLTAIRSLANENKVGMETVEKVMNKYNLDPEKPNPISV